MNPKHPFALLTATTTALAACGGTVPAFEAQGGLTDAAADSPQATFDSSGPGPTLDSGPPEAGDAGTPGNDAEAPGMFSVLAWGQTNPTAIVVASGSLYWADSGDPGYVGGSIMKATMDGSSLVQLASGAFGRPLTMITDATNVYWAAWPAGGGQWVMRTSIAAGTTTPLVFGQVCPQSIVVDATRVYWTNLCSGAVMACPIGGCDGKGTELVSGQGDPWGLAAYGTGDLAFVGTNLYWTNRKDGTVMRCNATACAESLALVATRQAGPTALVVDRSGAYWLNSGDGTVMRASARDGCVGILASGQSGPSAIAVDDGSVYWTNSGDGTVMTVPKRGSVSPIQLAKNQINPQGIAVNEAAVYWTNAGDGTVVKLTKPGGAI